MRATYLPERVVREAQSTLALARLSELFEALLRPALAEMNRSVAAMRIDARGDLSAIPWSALYDAREGRYLVERFAVWNTDDVWKEPVAARSVAASRVLVIDAAPRTGPRALPGAENEAQRVQDIWGRYGTRFDASEGATRALARIAEYEVVHFAGHAVLDAQRPDRSYLELLATSDTRISGSQLAASTFPRTRLVVLAACDTRGQGRAVVSAVNTSSSYGMQSLANAFVAAGVQHVIGAAWEIDDGATTAIIEQLHLSLRAGAAPARALREAQLTGLRSQDPTRRSPRVWAAFQLLGS